MFILTYLLTCLLKNQLVRLRTQGEEAFGVTLPQVKIAKGWTNQVYVEWLNNIGDLNLSSDTSNGACHRKQ